MTETGHDEVAFPVLEKLSGKARSEVFTLDGEACVLLSAVVDNIPDSILVVDKNYKVVLCNSVLKNNFFNHTGQCIKQGDDIDIFAKVTSLFDEWKNYLKRALNGEKFKVIATFEREGKSYHREAYFSPILHESVVVGATFCSKDTTLASINAERQAAILNALNDHIVLVDENGIIIAVNESWKRFGKENGLTDENYGLGRNYLSVCKSSCGQEESDAINMMNGLQDVLSGKTDTFSMEYTCHSSTEKRWFRAVVTPISKKYMRGAVVAHLDITARKLAANQLEFDRKNREALINSTSDFMWSIDKNMKLITANLPFVNLIENHTGWRPQPGQYMLNPEAFISSELKSWQHRYEQVLSGMTFTEEWFIEHDVNLWFDLSLYPILENGNVIGAACYARDITERKISEEKLREKSYHLKERVKELNCLYNSSIILNDSTKKIDEILAECVNIIPEAYQHPDEICARIKLLGKEFQTPFFKVGKWSQKVDIIIHDKRAGFLEVISSVNSALANGTPFLKEEFALINSIAKNIAHSVEHKMAAESLQKSEANIRVILEHTNLSYILLDRNYNILTFNTIANNWAKLAFGCELSLGHCLICMINEEQKTLARQVFDIVLAGQILENETSYKLTDGKVKWFHTKNFPVRNGKGEIIGICITAKDFTKRKEFETQREVMTAELIQRNKDLEQFTYIVSHNLRAPVANILGLSDVLLSEDLDEEEKKDILACVKSSIESLDNIITDINAILQTRLMLSDKRELVHFTDIVEEIKTSISQILQLENVSIAIDFSDANELLSLKGYMRSIFYNLISNSIKYKQPGVPPAIQITSKATKDGVELAFQDNGLGIDLPKIGKQLFGLHKRFHPQVAEGKGMGLFMVRTQVESLGGNIHVNSEVGKGTEFRITFKK